MTKQYPGTIESIPYGILSCLIAETEYAIEELSEHHILLRASVCAGENKLEANLQSEQLLHFFAYQWGKGYVPYGPWNFRLISVTKREYDRILLLETRESSYAQMVWLVAKQYTDYINLKLEGGNSFSKELIGYPAEADDCIPDSFSDWRNAFKVEPLVNALQDYRNQGIMLALEVQSPREAELFLQDESLVGRFDHLYIGNAFCPKLFPDSKLFERLLQRAVEEKMGITLVTGYLRENALEQQLRSLETAMNLCRKKKIRFEVEVGDWGYLSSEVQKRLFASGDVTLTLGRLPIKRRKDPRFSFYRQYDLQEKDENALNDEDFLAFLRSLGIAGVEAECCGRAVRCPNLPYSVHLPVYQTNSAQFCPLASAVLYGDRGLSREIPECDFLCETYAFLYPKHLGLMGRYNSLFAVDRTLLEHPGELEQFQSANLKRFVLNLWMEGWS